MPTPRFEQAQRRDPYRNFNFRILFGQTEVAACRKMSALDATVNVVKFRAGTDLSTVDECMPGRVEYQPVTFESGVTQDSTFEDWARQLVHHQNSRPTRPNDPLFRREITVQVRDLDGVTVAREYKLYRCFVSKFTQISDLAADGNDVLIETLEITHEGFERVPGAGAAGGGEEG
jgi:phage tail-like protein